MAYKNLSLEQLNGYLDLLYQKIDQLIPQSPVLVTQTEQVPELIVDKVLEQQVLVADKKSIAQQQAEQPLIQTALQVEQQPTDQSVIEQVETPNGASNQNRMFEALSEQPIVEPMQQQGGNPVLQLSDDEAEFKLE